MQPELSTQNCAGTESGRRKVLGKTKIEMRGYSQEGVILELGGGGNWKDLAMNKDGWRTGCETGWS